MTRVWIQGIDISKHQGKVDIEKVAVEGRMSFVIAKCTEGADYLDPGFEGYWKDLLALDPCGNGPVPVVRGAYHFGRPDNRRGRAGGEKEAKWFCSKLAKAGGYREGCLPPALDWEKWTDIDRDTRESNVQWIRAWLDVVESELGRRGMIYTGVNVWAGTTGDSDAFIDYPLWNVKYRESDSEPPRMPKDPNKPAWPWTLWQWSGGGRFNYAGNVPGVPGVVDVNRFNGSELELMQLAQVRRPQSRLRFEGQSIA